MAETLTDEQIAEMTEQAKRAHKHLCDICTKRDRFRMTIPRRDDDSDSLFGDACRNVETLAVAFLAERDTLQKRVGELEAGVLRQAGLLCFKCRFDLKPYRDDSGDWKHEGSAAFRPEPCKAAHLWDLLKPKTDPDLTDTPLNGDGGNGEDETAG